MYRVCFAGDSVFVIREIEPEAQVAPIWASFCGHMFAVAGLIHEMDEAMARRIEIWPVEKLIPYARNPRTHSEAQVAQIAASIAEFGFVNVSTASQLAHRTLNSFSSLDRLPPPRKR